MLQFENVYGKVTPQLESSIVDLWKKEGVLMDAQQIKERLLQVTFVIHDPEARTIAGVSTTEKKRVKALNNNCLYEFRCCLSSTYRIAGLDVKLSRETFDFLEALSKQDMDKPVGIFSILENETLKQEPVWRRAVWPEIEMYFVGYTNSGNPIRVHYFKGARI